MLTFALLLLQLPPQKQTAVVAEAKTMLDVPYVLGGRDKTSALDCQGLVFLALRAINTCGWRSYSVMPTTSVRGELGLPIGDAVAAAAIDTTHLEPGDVIYFLHPTENPAEPSLTLLDDTKMWVWHVGMYSGDGKVINADPFSGKVVDVDLVAYTKEHYAGIYVTRMKSGPKLSRCRR